MSVVINAGTGLAEDLPPDQAQAALQAGTHHVALNDPEGNPVTASFEDAPGLLRAGHTQPSPEQLQNLMDYSKYSSPLEQAKTILEGAGVAGTFGGSTKLETSLGVDPDAIRARRETNPGEHMMGEIGSLVGQSLLGYGEAPLLAKLGNAAAPLAGASKAGAVGVKAAIEMMGIQSGDEVSQLVTGENSGPAAAETAATHILLSGLLGAGQGLAFGALSPVWKAASETKLGKFLSILRDKANQGTDAAEPLTHEEAVAQAAAQAEPLLKNTSMFGPEGQGQFTFAGPGSPEQTAPLTVDQMAEKAGITIAPEVKAAIQGDPATKEAFRLLMESGTSSGQEAQASYRNFLQAAHDGVLKAVGRTAEDVNALEHVSNNDTGLSLMNGIAKDVDMDYHPLAQQFNQIKEAYKNVPVGTFFKNDMAEKAIQMGIENGYDFEGTPQNKVFQNFLTKWLPKIESLQDLRSAYSIVGEQTEDPKLWKLGTSLKSILMNTDDEIVSRQLAATNPEMVGANKIARAQYSELMTDIERIANRLHPGAYSGPESFLTQFSKMEPEVVVRRLTPTNDANLLHLIANRFPSVAEELRAAYVNQALKASANKAREPFSIYPKKFFDLLQKWSPELRQFALPEGAEAKLKALNELIGGTEYRPNSMTAKNLDSMWSKLPGGALAMASMITGHNPIIGYALGQGARYLGREAPDAMKLATLRFLGSANPIDAGGFKNGFDFIHSVIKGEHWTNKAVKAIFDGTRDVLPQALGPSEKKREKLKDKIAELQQDPSSLFSVGGNTGYYMPGHASALSEVASRAASVLNQLRPDQTKMGPLDEVRELSDAEKEEYDEALDVADQPLIALGKIRDGELTPRDVNIFKTIYPALYARVSGKIMSEIVERHTKEEDLPYDTKLGLSMFLGQPLDATMTQAAIATNQPLPAMPQPPAVPRGTSQKAGKAFGKGNALSQTTLQARAADKTAHG